MLILSSMEEIYKEEYVGKEFVVFFLDGYKTEEYIKNIMNNNFKNSDIKNLHDATGKNAYFILAGYSFYGTFDDEDKPYKIEIDSSISFYFNPKLQRKIYHQLQEKVLAHTDKKNNAKIRDSAVRFTFSLENNEVIVQKVKVYPINLKKDDLSSYYNGSQKKFFFDNHLTGSIKELINAHSLGVYTGAIIGAFFKAVNNERNRW